MYVLIKHQNIIFEHRNNRRSRNNLKKKSFLIASVLKVLSGSVLGIFRFLLNAPKYFFERNDRPRCTLIS